MDTLLRVLLLSSLLAIALSCAVPPKGCAKNVCDLYSGVSASSVATASNYTDEKTWSKNPALKYVGFYMGVYNKKFNGGAYGGKGEGWKKSEGSPALNYEKFKLESQFFVKGVANPIKTNLASCCHACRKMYGCVLYQYFDTDQQCYFLTGGSEKGDGPEGTPASGTREHQASDKVTKPSFVGGHCSPGKDGSNVEDDPHFTGAHGTRFDFNGELDQAFCLITDANIHVNALLRGYKDTNTIGATVGKDGKALRSWIREVGVMWRGADAKSHSLHLVARSGKQQERGDGFLQRAVLDGSVFHIPTAAGDMFEAGGMSLTFLGTGKKGPYDVDRYQLQIGDIVDLSIALRVAHPLLQTPTEAEVHFNLMFNDIKVTDKVHGVLGQTYRNTPAQTAKAIKYSELTWLLGEPIKADGETGKGFLDGAIVDYRSSNVLSTDCAVSTFAV